MFLILCFLKTNVILLIYMAIPKKVIYHNHDSICFFWLFLLQKFSLMFLIKMFLIKKHVLINLIHTVNSLYF